MSFVSLCRGCDDRLREALVFTHAVRKLDAADFAVALFVVAPGGACEYAADNHFHAESLAL